MSIAARAQNLGVDSTAVVAYENAQVARGVLKLQLDVTGVSMAECIYQRFAANKIDFITDGGAQWSRRALNDNAKPNLRLHREFLPNS